ncbi:MAG: hypothetical protein HY695_17020 [Deltaproteobacteria bacterium]|nr:hypothetical protein [Deltaproteobacteria bacterium]
MEPQSDPRTPSVNSKTKAFTAIRHASALLAGLGLFVAISAVSTGRNPSMVKAGLIITAIGLIGCVAGWLAGRAQKKA